MTESRSDPALGERNEGQGSGRTNRPPEWIDLSGERMGDFQLIRLLGQGGMADVYLAEQCSLKRMVAVKFLRPELAADDQYLQRFQNEARSVASLSHPNIVQIHEVGCIDGKPYLVQEYVAGQNLKQLLDRDLTLNAERTVAILSQVTQALRKAHSRGIVHRDIKPENILLSADGLVKVADFGLARQTAAGTDLTQIGITMGTPLYMSPEQIEGKPVDGRSDIYSLGITAYQMLAGHPPFQGDSPLSVALQHVREQPVPLSDMRDDLPNLLCEVILTMLAKSPPDRWATADELGFQLDQLLDHHSGSNQSIQTLTSFTENQSGEPLASETRALQRLLHPQHEDATGSSFVRNTTRPLHVPSDRVGRWIRGTAILLAAAILGGSLAWATRPRNPLASVEDTAKTIPHKESASAQFFYASIADTESAWKSVGDYFPLDQATTEKDRLAILRSKQQLSYWYLTNNRPSEAIPYLQQLAGLGEIDNDLRARGLAWLAIAWARVGETELAADVLADALSLGEFLDEPIMREMESLGRELKARLR